MRISVDDGLRYVSVWQLEYPAICAAARSPSLDAGTIARLDLEADTPLREWFAVYCELHELRHGIPLCTDTGEGQAGVCIRDPITGQWRGSACWKARAWVLTILFSGQVSGAGSRWRCSRKRSTTKC